MSADTHLNNSAVGPWIRNNKKKSNYLQILFYKIFLTILLTLFESIMRKLKNIFFLICLKLIQKLFEVLRGQDFYIETE